MNGFSAADMTTARAKGYRDASEGAAQEAVAWTVVGPDGKSSIHGWQDMRHHDFWKTHGVLRDGHKYAYAYEQVAAAPVDPLKLGAAMKAFDDAGGHAVSYAPAWMCKALEAASTPAAPGIDLATAWAKGYRSGVTDERISESNIGIAGFGAKIEPARANPYMIDDSHKGGCTDAKNATRYRHLQKVTPYRFKKMQDAAATDAGDVVYFHADRFDAALDADMQATSAEVGA